MESVKINPRTNREECLLRLAYDLFGSNKIVPLPVPGIHLLRNSFLSTTSPATGFPGKRDASVVGVGAPPILI